MASSADSLDPIAAALDTLVRRWRDDRDIAAVYLFGSRGRGQPRPASDVDLAVVLRAGLDADQRWKKRLELIGDATNDLQREDIDLIVLEDAPSVLGHRVLRDGRVLVERDPRRRVHVAERVLLRYLDEAPMRRALDAALTSRLRDGRFAR